MLSKEETSPETRPSSGDSLLFISYSRTDQSFVRKLDDRLHQHKRKTWVDWKDIPFTGEWEEEIYSAIEKADAFIFVISKRAAASVECTKEIGHAVKHNKRLVPIVREKVAHDDLDPAIAAVNWLPFQDSDDFETSLQFLISALDTDLEWVRTHTRLLVRAIEWNRNSRERSYTLRGADLRAAEAWLQHANEHLEIKPRPTTLQAEYVAASRRQELNRKRIAVTAMCVALVVVLTLAVVARQRGRRAQENAKRAGEQAQIALARELVARSTELREQLPGVLSTSALLALEATYRFPSRETESALRQSLYLIPPVLVTLPQRQRVAFIAFRPNGDCLEIADGIAHIWNIKTGDELPQSPMKGVNSAAYSPDEKFMAVAGSDSVAVLDSATFKVIATIPAHANIVALSPGTKYLTTGVYDTATIVDLRTQQIAVRIPYSRRLRSLAFSPDGRYLALAGDDWAAHVWDIEAKHEILRIKQEEDVWSVTFTPDGKYLVTATANDTTQVRESPDVVTSVLVAILATSLKTFKFEENWVNYRTTCETLKKEIHFLDAGIDEYKDSQDKEGLFVKRVEALISRENTLWLTTIKEKKDEEPARVR